VNVFGVPTMVEVTEAAMKIYAEIMFPEVKLEIYRKEMGLPEGTATYAAPVMEYAKKKVIAAYMEAFALTEAEATELAKLALAKWTEAYYG